MESPISGGGVVPPPGSSPAVTYIVRGREGLPNGPTICRTVGQSRMVSSAEKRSELSNGRVRKKDKGEWAGGDWIRRGPTARYRAAAVASESLEEIGKERGGGARPSCDQRIVGEGGSGSARAVPVLCCALHWAPCVEVDSLCSLCWQQAGARQVRWQRERPTLFGFHLTGQLRKHNKREPCAPCSQVVKQTQSVQLRMRIAQTARTRRNIEQRGRDEERQCAQVLRSA